MGVSKNNGIPKSLIGFSIINHPFWGTPLFGNTHVKEAGCPEISFLNLIYKLSASMIVQVGGDVTTFFFK